MFLEIMDTDTTQFPKPEFLRHGFKATWTQFCDSRAAKWAFEQNRNNAAARKHPSQDQRLAHRAKLSPFVMDSGKKKRKKGKRGSRNYEPVAAACMNPPPAGGMAPRNTTQYLMSNVYEDMKMDMKSAAGELTGHIYCENLSPSSVSAALDSCFEDILEYQLRDFEELYDLAWKPE